ncbi:hypothetical protein DMA15_33560 [Streptomyces sp. WAC 01529]|uniref:hypothetical protein n=1 Tax=Streptomyces sp. WAC 01529 TaxID=2203205 RepID=UPI000F711C25|nr:hypothetical protein [Streptomyces sp. WAC 01529]AZM56897.1 hypothetical protein DMA15_33560 [Streptomyces sp. WAC 01529]
MESTHMSHPNLKCGFEPSAEYLLDTPLPDLLAALNVKVCSRDGGPRFTGGACVGEDGSVLLVRPVGRPAAEWKMVARSMLGAALRVSMPPLPEPYRLTELPDAS